MSWTNPESLDKTWRWLSTLHLGLVLSGCAVIQQQAPEEYAGMPISSVTPVIEESLEPEPEPIVPFNGWRFERDAITLRVTPDESLNRFREQAHTLQLGIYQLSDPNPFNSLRATREGLQKLLLSPETETTIVAYKRITVAPGKAQTVILDRAASARHLGLVAGYYALDPGDSADIVAISAIQDPKEGTAKLNPMAEPPPPRPARMQIWIELGEIAIHQLVTQAQ